jgi:hypothetical protein
MRRKKGTPFTDAQVKRLAPLLADRTKAAALRTPKERREHEELQESVVTALRIAEQRAAIEFHVS